MTNDKKLEIQIQFLEEATEYLNTLEAVLLEGKDNGQIALQKINAALRAAHSIKGGADIMGFRILSDLAHRLEDVFILLQTRKHSLEIDTDLYSLLLSGVDWLRQIVKLYSEGYSVDEQWLAAFCYPLFEEIHKRLGYPIEREFSGKNDKFVDLLQSSTCSHKTENQENKLRVSVKQLEQVNDLFEKFTIQSHSFKMQIERLHKLSRHLSNRVKNIERESYELHLAYAKLTQYQGHNDWQLDSSLEIDHHNELNVLYQTVMETIVKIQEITTNIQHSLKDTDQVNCLLNKTAQQLQQSFTEVQMRPLSEIVERFPGALHDMSVEYGKNVHLKIEGANTLIECGILEALNEPLMHLLRNAFEHGIEDAATRRACGKPEQGLIEIKATHHGDRTLITIRDDGRGLWQEKIRTRALAIGLEPILTQATDEELLSPGLCTSKQVTTLSCCGVGMDMVCSKLKLVQGEIKVNTVPGVGTTFTLSVPFIDC